jgi:hypothetical protein
MNNDIKTLAVKLVSVFLFLGCYIKNASAQHNSELLLAESKNISTAYSNFRDLQLLDSIQPYRNRKQWLVTAGVVAYTGGMAGLYKLWYADYENESFHFFNDGKEWLQMDKCGHLFTTYQISRLSNEALLWAGFERKNAILKGAGYAMLFQTTIEAFDGFSSAWGFSWFDMLANTIGAGLFVGQQLEWQEQRITVKFSYHASPYANDRPNVLGSTPITRVFKDYNGQTYWLSTPLSCWWKHNNMPQWLAISMGYGAQGMTGGYQNLDASKSISRNRQFYLAADIDLTRIKCKSKLLKSIFNTINIIKLPAPTLSFEKEKGLMFYPLYF